MKKTLSKITVSILVSGFLLVGTPIAKADSPLTSTSFADAYGDVDLVEIATEQGLTAEVLAALSDRNVPNDVRAAIINAIGWSVEGQQNARTYLKYIACRRGQEINDLRVEELTPQETFSLGYLLAMDNYSNLSALGGKTPLERLDALTLLTAAVIKQPTDFAVALVHSLAQAQRLMLNSQWCKTYRRVAAVRDDFVGIRNLRPEAVAAIMDYISSYQDSCRPENSKLQETYGREKTSNSRFDPFETGKG